MLIATSRHFFKYFLLISLFVLGSSATAQSAAVSESNWQFSIAVGPGVRTNPVMDNDNVPLIVIPQVSYQGEHFFIQNLDLGYTFFQDDARQLSILLTPSYDQIFFNDRGINNFVDTIGFTNTVKSGPTVELVDQTVDKRRLHKRHMAGLAGVEYNQTFSSVDFQLQLLHEVTNYYDGNEVRIALSKAIRLGKNDVKLTLGANWQDAGTLHYFYGLTPAEALNKFPYDASSGITRLLRFDWNYEIDEHWSLRFFTSYRHLSHSISDSPLVTSNNVITAFAGGVYHF